MPESVWTSLHVAVDGDLWGEDGDRLLLDVLLPAYRRCHEAGLADRWFFVRYTMDEPHLRFRLHRPPGVPEAPVRAALEAACRGRRIDWPGYEPELERYGGTAGVAVSEVLFGASSRAAAGALAKLSPGDRSARLGKALLAMLAGLQVFEGPRLEAARMADNYSRSYLRHMVRDEGWLNALENAFEAGFDRQADELGRFIEAGWQALEGGDGLPADLERYRRDLVETHQRLRELYRAGRLAGRASGKRWRVTATGIVPSYFHMHSNRLGVRVTEECYLARLIAETLTTGPTRSVAAAGGSEGTAPGRASA